MEREKKKHGHKHMDESEIFKQRSLMAKENRKKMAKLLNLLMVLLAIVIIIACFFAYFVDK